MSRFTVTDQLSFKYPKQWTVRPIVEGECYELLPQGKRGRMERYYFSFFQSREPYIAFGKKDQYDAYFYKTADGICREVEQKQKVNGFRIDPFPNVFQLDLRLGEYASFRVGELGENEKKTPYVILTWNRMYYHSNANKTKIFSSHFTGIGHAKRVTERLKSEANNLISGVRYSSPLVTDWRRHPFPKPWKDYDLVARNKRNSPQKLKPAPPSNAVTEKPPQRRTNFRRKLVRTNCYRCSGLGNTSCYSCNGQGGHYESKSNYDYNGNYVTETYWVSCYCGNGRINCSNCGGLGYTEKYQ